MRQSVGIRDRRVPVRDGPRCIDTAAVGKMAAMAEQFDRAYYERYYENPSTRVAGPDDVRRLAAFVLAYLEHVDVPVRRVLDLGCGLGWWRDALETLQPGLRYTGVEISQYLCDRYGWTHGSVVDYSNRTPFDLVICQGVLQYLSHSDAARAIDSLSGLCRGALYLEVLTREDWEANCDRERTDGSVMLRKVDWYRRRLRPGFVNAGGGVFLSRSSGAVLFAIEEAD